MSETTSANYLYIKGKINSQSQKLYGIIIVSFSPDGYIHSNQAIMTSFSDIMEINPESPWDKIEDEIIKIKWGGKYNTNVTNSIQSQFGKLNEDSFIRSQLYDALNDYDFTSAETVLFDILNRILADKGMHLEIGIQEVSFDEIQSVKERRNNESKEKYNKNIAQKSDFEIEKGAVILNTSPILSPVKGKPLYDLKIGDRIMVKIEPTSDQQNYYIDYFKLRKENRIKPVPGEVTDIKAESKEDPVYIIVKLDQGLYGKCIEEERQVKLRLYDPRLDGHIAKTQSSQNVSNSKDLNSNTNTDGMPTGTFVLISALLFLIVIAFIFIFLMI